MTVVPLLVAVLVAGVAIYVAIALRPGCASAASASSSVPKTTRPPPLKSTPGRQPSAQS